MAESSILAKLRQEWEELTMDTAAGQALPPSTTFLLGPGSPVRPFVLFAELEDTRLAWKELLEQFHIEEQADRLITPLWTVKDLIAHVTSWTHEFRNQVEIAVSGQTFDYFIPFAMSSRGATEWNQSQVEKRRSQSLESLKEEFETETCRLQDLVLSLPEEFIETRMQFPMSPTGDPSRLWRGNIAQLVQMKCLHDRSHLELMQEWERL